MSLINFRYLRRQRVVTLVLILVLTSTLFSLTAYSFLGFYNGLTDYVGEERNVVALYSKIGSTPLTGVIPLAALNQISSATGVVAASPEVIAPCMVNGHSVFVRGVVPQELASLNPLTLLLGSSLIVNDTDSAILGEGLAVRLNLNVGDKILLLGVLSQHYVQLQIKGVFQSQSPLNDEVLVPLYVGQWLRGISYDEVTFIRAKINPAQTSVNQLYREIANRTQIQPVLPAPAPTNQAQQQLQALIPPARTDLNFGNIGVEASQQFMSNYLDRYGVTQDTLVILSVIVLIFASGTAITALTLFIKQHDFDISVVRSIGTSARKIKIDLALRMLVWSVIATVLGTLISALLLYVFQATGYLLVLSHTIAFQLDPAIVAANILLLALLGTVNIAKAELQQ